MSYTEKYLKYKSKYLSLKKKIDAYYANSANSTNQQLGGSKSIYTKSAKTILDLNGLTETPVISEFNKENNSLVGGKNRLYELVSEKSVITENQNGSEQAEQYQRNQYENEVLATTENSNKNEKSENKSNKNKNKKAKDDSDDSFDLSSSSDISSTTDLSSTDISVFTMNK